MPIRPLPALLLACFTFACADAASEQAAAEDVALWRIAPTPLLAVGRMDGAEGELFTYVEDAARLPDGGLVVLDAEARELRFFGPSGEYRGTAGRAGSGPGEFRAPFRVQVIPGDTVVAWDFARAVLSYWSPEGELLSERPGGHHPTIHEGDLLPDGTLAVPRYGSHQEPASGRYRPSATLIRYGRGEPRELGAAPYDEMYAGGRSGAPAPFLSRTALAAGGRPLRIVVGDDTNRPSVRVYDETGESLGEMDLRDTRRPVTPALWEAQLDDLRARFGETPELERDIALWEKPDSTPAFDALVIDAKGRLWVLRHEEGALRAVVHEDGKPVAELDLPELAKIFEIGPDYIVGLHKGALDVASIRVYGYEGL
jgi:hypothetical protein